MSWGLLHWSMLAGLAGAAIPVVIHLFNRTRTEVVDWGAMQFLELDRSACLKFQLSELLLLIGRMALLAVLALALARPFWIAGMPQAQAANAPAAAEGGLIGRERRDVVLVFDGSGSMGRKVGGHTIAERAVDWAQQFVATLGPGDSAGVLVAGDRVTPVLWPPSFDRKRIAEAIGHLPRMHGASNWPMAVAEALRLLEQPGNPTRDIIILTDQQRFPWHADLPARWAVARDVKETISRRTGVTPRIWALDFQPPENLDLSNGSVAPLEISGGLITPGRSITISTTVTNSGTSSLMRTAELLVDDEIVPGTAETVGPLPPAATRPLTFKTAVSKPGSHVFTVRLTGNGDDLADDDEASHAIEVTALLRVLLVDGEPGVQPLSSETDFLRAALAPVGADDVAIKTRVVRVNAFQPADLKDCRVIVLANVERLDARQNEGVIEFLNAGGGVLVACGDLTDVTFANKMLFRDGAGWLPAQIGETKGDATRRQPVAHPAPRTFLGPGLASLGRGDSPALAGADLFEYRVLLPAKGSAVQARLDTGDPWIVERPFGRGRVMLVASAIDAEGGTLPVNPDFVPWTHELIYHLAHAVSTSHASHPNEPLFVNLDLAPSAVVAALPVTTPGGLHTSAPVVRSEGKAQVRIDDTAEWGTYRVQLPNPPGGLAFATVAADDRESDLRRLEPAAAQAIAEVLPIRFEAAPARSLGQIFATTAGKRHEVWRYLILATLAGLCLEVWMTRRMVKNRGGITAAETL